MTEQWQSPPAKWPPRKSKFPSSRAPKIAFRRLEVKFDAERPWHRASCSLRRLAPTLTLAVREAVSLHIRTDPAGLGRRPPLLLEGVSEAKPEDEDHEGDGADGEERVAGHPHPAQGLHVTLAEELAAARIPVAVLDRGHRLQEPDGEQTQQNHGHQAYVHRPEGEPEQAFLPLAVGLQRPQAHQGETQSQQAVDTEKSGVSMHRRRVETLHVEESDRRVDHEAEESGAYQVPEPDGDEEVDGPAVLARPFGAAGDPQVLHRLTTDQDQGHHLERAHRRAPGQGRGGSA